MKKHLTIFDIIHSRLRYYLKDSLSKETQRTIARFLERTIYLLAIAGPVLTLPQVYKIWTLKTAVGFSLITWGGYLVLSFMWLMYGIFTDAKPLIVANSCWIVLHGFIITGIVMYG
jgi:MtN3 and saliva related transmembrane protein